MIKFAGRAVSSVHKDHYENMYCVLSGEKIFTLLPPSDIAFLGEKHYPSARHRYDTAAGHWTTPLDHDETGKVETVPWIELDPGGDSEVAKRLHPDFEHASAVTVTVKAGQTLYIPAMVRVHLQFF